MAGYLSNSEGDGLPQVCGFFHLSLCPVLVEPTKFIPLLKCGGAAGAGDMGAHKSMATMGVRGGETETLLTHRGHVWD